MKGRLDPRSGIRPGQQLLGRLRLRAAFLKRRARRLKRQVWALFLAWGYPGTPWAAKAVIAVTVAYALSPIDLIPDFIPVLGQLDDLVIVPALISLALRLIPPAIAAKCRREAWKNLASGARIQTKAGAIASLVFILVWVAAAAWILSLFI
jgi:uncharacterized membrane protein YkvA (DUF1232 family)